MVGQIFSTDLLETCLKIGRFRLGRGGRFLTAPEKTRQISKIRQIFYDNQGISGWLVMLIRTPSGPVPSWSRSPVVPILSGPDH